MMDDRRGQSGNKAGLMVVLTTVILILYLLFLPPQNRDALLYGDEDPTDSINDSDVIERLVDAEPGDLEYVGRDKQRYSIPAYTVSSKLQGIELQREDAMRVANSLFSERQRQITFTTTPALTQDVKLSFNVESASGELTVMLNGEHLYTDDLGSGSVPPIRIDQDRLQTTNNLTFSVNPPGVAFWAANEYELENVRVTARVKDTSQNRNYQTVYIPEKNFDRIERAEIDYIASCNEVDVEDFEVTINDFVLFQGTPDCALATEKTFDPSALKPGQNQLLTQVDTGSVLVDRFTLTTYFDETEEKTYYFELDDEYFDQIRPPRLNDDYDVNASFTFADDDEKQFNLYVNGRRTSVTTRDPTYQRAINRDVKPGTNVIRVEPRNDFTVSTLTVDLTEGR